MALHLSPALALGAGLLLATATLAALSPPATLRTPSGEMVATSSPVGVDLAPDTADSTLSKLPATDWRWPLEEPVTILRPFDWQGPDWQPAHRGVDLAASPGDAVYAAADAVVVHAGTVVDRGIVSLGHGDLRTSVEPVKPAVKKGAQVSQGDLIGWVADTGGHCDAQTCLHVGVRRGAEYLDPASLASPHMRAVLLA